MITDSTKTNNEMWSEDRIHRKSFAPITPQCASVPTPTVKEIVTKHAEKVESAIRASITVYQSGEVVHCVAMRARDADPAVISLVMSELEQRVYNELAQVDDNSEDDEGVVIDG